jgi:hypothetical protein
MPAGDSKSNVLDGQKPIHPEVLNYLKSNLESYITKVLPD